MERVRYVKFLGIHISDDLTWTCTTTQLVKKAQQQLHFLRGLRKYGTSQKILCSFRSCIREYLDQPYLSVVWEYYY